jgi:hypothetical protein
MLGVVSCSADECKFTESSYALIGLAGEARASSAIACCLLFFEDDDFFFLECFGCTMMAEILSARGLDDISAVRECRDRPDCFSSYFCCCCWCCCYYLLKFKGEMQICVSSWLALE